MPDEAGTTTAPAPEQATGTTQEQSAPATSAPDSGTLDRILSRVDELGTQVSGLTERFATQETGTEEEPALDDVDAILQELGYEAPDEETVERADEEQGVGDLNQRELVELVLALSQRATKAELERSVMPQLASQTEKELESAFADLETRHPQLLDDEWQGKVLDTAERLAQQTGDARWLEHPTFLEVVHKSLLSDDQAEQETPVEARDEGLENPRGVNPGANESEDTDAADRIVMARGHKVAREAGLI